MENINITGGDNSWRLGGLCGGNGGWPNPGGTITNCYSGGSVTGGDESCGLGGLCGGNGGVFFGGGPIINCYATGSVTGGTDIGGLCGWNDGPITNCYATGSVTGGNDIGGLCGINSGSITRCYAIGRVSGDNACGGLIGSRIFPDPCGMGLCVTISACYWNTEISGLTNMCGEDETGQCDDSYGKTTSQLHQQSTFTGWNFINTWNIGENQTYPYIRTYSASDINKDRITNFGDLGIVAEQWMNEE